MSSVTRDRPLRVAAMDVGSNAMRFLAAEVTSEDDFQVLEVARTAVRLGASVFENGALSDDCMRAATAAMRDYRERMDALGILDYRAVATSAVRESSNGVELLARVQREATVTLEPIGAEEEARLVHRAVRSRIPLDEREWVLVDLGGGSAEVSLANATAVAWTTSHPLGAVRLLAELEGPDGLERCRSRIDAYVSRLQLPAAGAPAGFVATGGNSEALAVIASAPCDERGVSHIPLATLQAAADTLAGMPRRDRVRRFGLRSERADVVLPAAMVYAALCEQFGFEAMLVPHVGVREGVVLDVAARIRAL